ncbi:MAG: 2,3-bisphosphoglycerate-independent phosphoglycerate mutase, partial [halophilic archaeon J07HX5]
MELGLVVLDGWGINPDPERDAVAAATTPTIDRLTEQGAAAQLQTHGRAVGLTAGQMGNSEVGHLTIGAGRVVRQESTRITDAIASWRGDPQGDDPPLDKNPALAQAFAAARRTGGRVHLLGLVSDGGVHASQAHLHALIDLAAERGVTAVTHAFTDGRDTPPTSATDYLERLAKHAAAAGTGQVATVTGRYYAMDRDENWARTQRAYNAVVHRDAAAAASNPVAAVEAAYDRGTTDEFVEPTLIEGRPALVDDDSVVVVNFRADRARQLTRLLVGDCAGV